MKRRREPSLDDICRNKRKKIINKINHSISYDIDNADINSSNKVIFEDSIIKGKVQGSYGYHDLQVSISNSNFNIKCDCQLDKPSAFCKHSLDMISKLIMNYVKSASNSLEDHIKEEVCSDLIDQLTYNINNFKIN